MKRLLTLLTLFLLTVAISNISYAGGIVTNTNQSASYIRMPVQDATVAPDGAYYNPAGLAFLNNGLYISISNQSIFQTETVSNDYTYLNTEDFEGKASAPLFPGIYAALKLGKLAFSLGFNPIGGGGTAEYDKGLPSFEIPISDLVPGMGGPANASYTTDIYFKGKSVYWGIQGGVSYKFTDWISGYAGIRYNMAQNNYEGFLKNSNLKTVQPGYNGRADLFFRGLEAKYKAAKEQFAQAGLNDSALKYGTLEAQMGIKATLLGDQTAEVEQTGSGITPILGLHFSLLNSNLNIGLKYEFNTALTLKNNTTKDVMVGYDAVNKAYVTKFPNGAEFDADIPALLSLGAQYRLFKDLMFTAGLHYYFDKNADWDGLEKEIESNTIEIGAGTEYTINDKFLVSLGYFYAAPGVSNAYQTDMTYQLPSNSFGFGGKYRILSRLDVNLGFMYTAYVEGTKTANHDFSGGLLPSTQWPKANYTFNKSNFIIGLGFDFHLFGRTND